MEDTGDGSVEPDPREWSSEKVATFVRALGGAQCFQSATDQVVQLGVDGSVFFDLSLNDLQGVRGQMRIWVDNFRASMKRKKAGEDKQSEPNDKE
jgi:hypothetical protein